MITFGTFRVAARGAGGTPGQPPVEVRWVNTAQTRARAVRCYHRDGLAAALEALEEGFSSPTWKKPSPAGKAKVARDLFATYVQLDALAGRPYAELNLKHAVALGKAMVNVDVDVVLFDPTGDLCGRVLLWDVTPCTAQQARTIAAPCITAIDAELGDQRATSVSIWHLRSGIQHDIDRPTAIAATPHARSIAEAYDVP